MHDNFPMLSKFHGIAHQIGEDLPQPPWIASHPGRQASMHQISQFQPFAVGMFGQEFEDVFYGDTQLKVDLF